MAGFSRASGGCGCWPGRPRNGAPSAVRRAAGAGAGPLWLTIRPEIPNSRRRMAPPTVSFCWGCLRNAGSTGRGCGRGAGQPSGVGGGHARRGVSEAACFEVPDGEFHLGVFAAAVRRLQAETGCCCWLRRDGTASRLQLSLGAGGAGAADGQPQRRPPRRVEDGLSGVGLPAVWAAVGVQSFSGMALAAALAWAWSGIVTGRPAARRSSVSIRA